MGHTHYLRSGVCNTGESGIRKQTDILSMKRAVKISFELMRLCMPIKDMKFEFRLGLCDSDLFQKTAGTFFAFNNKFIKSACDPQHFFRQGKHGRFLMQKVRNEV